MVGLLPPEEQLIAGSLGARPLWSINWEHPTTKKTR